MKVLPSWLSWRKMIVADTRLTSGEKYMGLYLNTYMNDNQDSAFPSVARMAGETAQSHTTVIKHLTGLCDKGYLTRQKRFGKTVIYHAMIPKQINDAINSLPEVGILESHSIPETLPPVFQKLESNKQENKQDTIVHRPADIRFEQFWTRYPRKEAKQKAAAAFRRLSATKQQAAIDGLDGRFDGKDRQYIMLPTTYLNGERWEDELPTLSRDCPDMAGAL